MHRIRSITLVLLAVLVAAGCASTPEITEDERAVRATIERYNVLLTTGYRTLDMNPIQEVATQLQAETEYIHMSSLAEGGIRLDPELKDLEYLTVSVEATSATAETRETWDYRHYSRATGELVTEQRGLIYHLAWDLVREPGGPWLVSDVRAISATSTAEPSVFGTITPTPPEQ